MEAFPRIALLGACVATGVSLAICIVLSLADNVPVDDHVAPAPTHPAMIAAATDASATSPELADAAPLIAPVEPRVADDFAPPAAVASTDNVATVPTDKPAEETAAETSAESSKWVSELIDVVRLQAAQSQAAQDQPSATDRNTTEFAGEGLTAPPVPEPVAEPEPTITAQVNPPADLPKETTPPIEPLPEPRGPIVERSEGDDTLRITVQNSDIRDVLELLSQQGDLNILTTKSVTGTVSASLVGVDVESALAAILKSTGFVARREGKYIYVGTPEDFQLMDQSLDTISTRVYRPNYIRAAELQALIAPLLSTGVGKVTVSTPAQIDIPASQIQTGGDMMTGSDVVIVKDYERVLLQIDQLVHEVDCRPRQVLIDAMIISVKLSDENKFGINWQILKNKANVKLGLGTPLASLAGVDLSDGGLNFGFVDESLTNVIAALETIGETNVVAAPRLLCLNKQRAEIQIGEQLGYVSTTVTETSSTQSIQFLDVGTLLRLRPFISGDGTIRMEVHPELSTGTVDVEAGLTLPNKEVTQVTTNVMCQNGSTVIIGGLIREDLQSDIDQIPILGNIPVAGALFRQRTDKIDRREILVLITPRLVEEPDMSQEGAKLGNDFLRRQNVVFDKMSPIGRRYHGEQYLRKAKAAWAAGDAKIALKYANLSIEHDPMSREAINLREEVAAVAAPNESVHDYLKQGIHLGHRPHRDYSKKGSPWKDTDVFEPGIETVEPWSPGASGTSVRIDAPPSLPATLNHAKRPAATKRR